MIRRDPLGVTPAFQITIDGASVDYTAINEIEVYLEAGLHDMVVLRMGSLPTRASASYRNRAVHLTFDTGANYYHEFVGYVIDVRPTSISAGGLTNGSPFQDAELVCLGVSYDMRGSRSRVWNDYSLQDVVADMAARYGFSADVPADPLILSPMVQSNESDWQFLVRYASELGYETTLHGTYLHVFDPHKALPRNVSFHRLLSTKKLRQQMRPHPGQIIQFKASLAEHHPDGKYKDTVVSVHSEGGDIYDVSLREIRGLSSPARFTDRLGTSADTYEQAKRTILAHSKQNYDFSAEVKVVGVAGCKPGGVVDIQSYDSEVDGLWYVRKVHHHIVSGSFYTDLDLARNIESELLQPSKVTAFTHRPPASKLAIDTWRSSKRIFNAYH